ncbi:MAG: CTP synthase [Flavobacteriaceae bacterium]|nr:CTP synthase [Flavobacteriaceae bacterium]MBL6684492.1 CTP synthase [Flavobacteriaceae bacterium]
MKSKILPKYIFVTGGVSSSLGKGIISASLAKLLQSRGLNVTIQKFDPYINIDPGTLNPYEHGECYVTEDGTETDLDLGHYERFLNIRTSESNNTTTGQIYQTVINKERKGDFLGKTVQVIPHITNEIKRRIKLIQEEKSYDVIITELGGTVGDIESYPFIEAVRQFRWEVGMGNSLVIHLTLLPYLSAAGELKTKPTQHSVKKLMESGVNADIIVCRTEHSLNDDLRKKIALFCNVQIESVIESVDASTIYEVPILMQNEKLDDVVLKKLNLNDIKSSKLHNWNVFVNKIKNPSNEVNIGLIGKYVELQDSYKSILESFVHAGAANDVKVNVITINSEEINIKSTDQIFKNLNGILVAPGFGERGVEGKIEAIRIAREKNIPFLGICLGMQMAVIEFARNVLGFNKANSTEMDINCKYPVISMMKSQKNIKEKGGTMRLGSWKCVLENNSLAHKIYSTNEINERHRHRYELNFEFMKELSQKGMVFSGKNPDTGLVEIIELCDHPWFFGVQFHPEYRSTVEEPHPVFVSFVKASLSHKNK